MVFKKKKKVVKKAVEEPVTVEEEFDESEFEEEEESEEEEVEVPTPTETPVPAPVAKAKPKVPAVKAKDIWTVETIATETSTVIRNNETGEDYDATRALVKILNYLEE